MLLLVTFTVIVNMSGLFNIEPWFVLNYGGEIIGCILIVPYPPRVTVGELAKLDIPMATYFPAVSEGLVIIGLNFIITMALGLLLFEKKEFT